MNDRFAGYADEGRDLESAELAGLVVALVVSVATVSGILFYIGSYLWGVIR